MAQENKIMQALRKELVMIEAVISDKIYELSKEGKAGNSNGR